jgi:Asp-tRNA(Asn)/Glu-tRNA(Gln) amidotransferase B subunit
MNKEFLKMQKLAGIITENQVNEYSSEAIPFEKWKSAITDFIQKNLTDDIDELDMLNDVLREIIADNEQELEDPENQEYLSA